MAMFKANIQAIQPYRTHFREMDVIFSAKDEAEADEIAEEYASIAFLGVADVNSVYRLGR